MDVFTPAGRSKIMAAIKSSKTKSTELRFRAWLVSKGVRGWIMKGQGLPGTPDFIFPRKKIAVFIDGCFWHGCLKCKRNLSPQSNKRYWEKKISTNMARDKKRNLELKKSGWTVARVWEHDLDEISESRIKRLIVPQALSGCVKICGRIQRETSKK